jgi:hypothetical protein
MKTRSDLIFEFKMNLFQFDTMPDYIHDWSVITLV